MGSSKKESVNDSTTRAASEFRQPLLGSLGGTQDAYGKMQAGMAPGGMVDEANKYLTGAIRGDYMDPNSGPLKDYLGVLRGDLQNQFDTVAARSGRGNYAGSGDMMGNLMRFQTAGLAEPLLRQFNIQQAQRDAAARAAPAFNVAAYGAPAEWQNSQIAGLSGAYGQDSHSKTTEKTTPSAGQTLSGIGLMALSAMSGNPMLMAGAAGGMAGAFSPGGAMSAQYGPPSASSPMSPPSMWKMPWQ